MKNGASASAEELRRNEGREASPDEGRARTYSVSEAESEAISLRSDWRSGTESAGDGEEEVERVVVDFTWGVMGA